MSIMWGKLEDLYHFMIAHNRLETRITRDIMRNIRDMNKIEATIWILFKEK